MTQKGNAHVTVFAQLHPSFVNMPFATILRVVPWFLGCLNYVYTILKQYQHPLFSNPQKHFANAVQYLFGLGSQGEVQATDRQRAGILTSQLGILFCYHMDFKTHYLPDR